MVPAGERYCDAAAIFAAAAAAAAGDVGAGVAEAAAADTWEDCCGQSADKNERNPANNSLYIRTCID
jgi:hypothetical protein